MGDGGDKSLATPQSATSTSEMTPGISSTRPSERSNLGVTDSIKRSLVRDFDTPVKGAKKAKMTQPEYDKMSLMELVSYEVKPQTRKGPPLSQRRIVHGWWPLKGLSLS